MVQAIATVRRLLPLAALLPLLLACGGEGDASGAGSDGAGPAGSPRGGDPMAPSDEPPEVNDPAEDPSGQAEPNPSDSNPTGEAEPDPTAPDAMGSPPTVSVPASDALLVPALRLTREELDHVLEDVLLDVTDPASAALAEDEHSPFDNDFARQTVSQALVDSLQFLAEDVAARAVDSPEAYARIVPCTPSGAGDAACFDQVVERLGRVFFRGPVSDGDLASYRVLLDFAIERDDFAVAVELLIASFLQDPEFLYRLERGSPGEAQGVLALNGYEIATRLSFLFWGTGPDEELLASAPELTSPDARRAAAERLLEDDRARRQMHRFHAMWLGYRSLPEGVGLSAAFRRETEALVERAVFSDAARYLSLFDSAETYLDEALAQHYALPAPAGGEGWVTYPTESGRAGVLSHGSVLSAFSKFSDTSPTQRGIFVRTRLLCQSVPPPPAVVDVDQPPEGEESGCKIDRYIAHAEQSGCVECHRLFDPIGFGLERYDMAGRKREHDDGNPDCVIAGTGELPGLGEFSGPAELSALLIEAGALESCFARHLASHLLGSSELDAGQLALSLELGATLADTGDVRALLVDLASSERFALRAQELP